MNKGARGKWRRVEAAMSSLRLDAKQVDDPASRTIQTICPSAKMPTVAAFIYRHTQGPSYGYPTPM